MNSEKFSSHTETETPEALMKKIGHKILSIFNTKKSGETASNDSYLLSKHLSAEEVRIHKSLIDNWDNKFKISMSNELGELIEKYVNDPDYRFGVHRSTEIDGNNPMTDIVLQEVMQNGIVVLGDARSGSIRNNAPPTKSVDFADSLLNGIIFTKSSRWGSNGAVLVAIPSKYLNEEGEIIPGKEKEVYNYNKVGNPLIKPEFILGFAPGGGRRGAHIKFISRDEILNSTDKDINSE